jgi:hypothetical protein
VTLYSKRDSISHFQANADVAAAVCRIRARRPQLMAASSGDQVRAAVVTRACADLLDPHPDDETARFTLQPHVAAEMANVSDEDLTRFLYYRYRYDVFPQTHEVDAFPPCLQIEPTSICNYRCVFCFQTDPLLTTPRYGHMGTMPLDRFRRIVDEVVGACEAVTLASRGEPLMCRDIEGMLAYAAGKFLALKINTNAWFLDERKAHAILQAEPVTVVFSADAAAEPLYSQLRVNGRLDRVLANIERFQEIRARAYPRARVITRVSGVQYGAGQHLDDMAALWGRLVDQVTLVAYNPWENTYERPVNNVGTPCSDLWRRMFVWFDGRINPCDIDYRSMLAVGAAGERSLSDLWTGEPYVSYRAAHLCGRRSTLSPCNRCTFV